MTGLTTIELSTLLRVIPSGRVRCNCPLGPFTEIKSLDSLGSIEDRKEHYDDIGQVDCKVFYPDKELYNMEISKKKSWIGTMYSMFKYFYHSKSKKGIELKYNIAGS